MRVAERYRKLTMEQKRAVLAALRHQRDHIEAELVILRRAIKVQKQRELK